MSAQPPVTSPRFSFRGWSFATWAAKNADFVKVTLSVASAATAGKSRRMAKNASRRPNAPAAASGTSAAMRPGSFVASTAASAVMTDSLGMGGKKPSTKQHTATTTSALGESADSMTQV